MASSDIGGIATNYSDPIAQTFTIDQRGGCFLTRVELFFSAKDENLPVTLEIRNTIGGYPGPRVLPFAKATVRPAYVNVSANSNVATPFIFASPVYVQEGGEYAIVLLTNSFNYRVWVSQLGENLVGTDRRITQQPYSGALYKSQNASFWTPDPYQDLKFRIYRAQFDTANIGKLSLVNETVSTRTLPKNALVFSNFSPIITVMHPSHGMPNGSSVTLSGFTDTANVKSSDINKTHTISNVLIDSYTIVSGNAANVSTTYTPSNIRVSEDIVFDVLQPIIQNLNFPQTSLSYTANVSATTLGATRSGSPVNIIANENNYFASPKAIKSVNNETGSGSDRKALEVLCYLKTTQDNLSPVIDLNRTSVVAVSNRIDDLTANIANFAHHNRTIVSANTKIEFSGNVFSTTHPTVANVLAQLVPGKTITLTNVGGNPTNNANVVISSVKNLNGVANVTCYYTFATELSGNTYTIVQKENFVDERAPQNGSAAAKYITRQLNFQNPSRYLRIMFAANAPAGTAIDVYYRTLVLGSFTPLKDVNFVPVSPTSPIRATSDPSEFFDITYEIDNLPAFSAAAVKIVFRSSNSSQIPSIKDLRIIACP